VRITQFLVLQIVPQFLVLQITKTASSTRTAYYALLSGSVSPYSLRYTIWMLHQQNKLNVFIQIFIIKT